MCFGIRSYGCSTFRGAASTTSNYVISQNAFKYISQAKQASMPRLYAAIHYSSDCEKGLLFGNKVGN